MIEFLIAKPNSVFDVELVVFVIFCSREH